MGGGYPVVAGYPYGVAAPGWGPALPPHMQPAYGQPAYGQPAYPPAGTAPAPARSYPVPADEGGTLPPAASDLLDNAAPGYLPSDPSGSPLSPIKGGGQANVASRSRMAAGHRPTAASVATLRATEIAYPDADAHPRTAGMKISVPSQAKVYLNGKELRGSGNVRRFNPGEPLIPGVEYNYALRVEVVHNGTRLVKSVSVSLHPGRLTQISCDFPALREVVPESDPKVAAK